MQVCTCFLLLGAFAYTHSNPVTKPTEDKRATNLTLKSIPELNAKETSKNDNVATNKTLPQPHSTDETFTDFMQELVIILNTYNDGIFEDFIDIVDKEIKKYTSQNELQKLLAEKLNLFMKKSVAAKRAVINQIVDWMKLLKIFDTNVRELLDYINSLYRKDAKKKFQIILTDLKSYSAGYGNSTTKDGFARLIKECVRATVFIHGNLNTDVKQKLKKHTDTFVKKIKEFYSSTGISSTANFVTRKPTISKTKSNTYTDDKTTKTSLKLNTIKTTVHIKEENKGIIVFNADTSEAKQENVTTKTSLITNPTKTTAHLKEENEKIIVFRADTSGAKQENVTITTKTSSITNPTKTTAHIGEENKRIIVFRADTSEAKQENVTITTKTSLITNPTKTTAHLKEEYKRIIVFRTDTNETKPEDTTTSKRDDSKSQQKNVTHASTNETATEVMFFMTTEKQGIVYKSESKSKLVENMLEENSTKRKVTGQSTTTPGKRVTTKKYLRRTNALPLPGEELSVEIFDRDRRRRRKKTHTRSSKFTTESPELKDYLRRLKLKTQLDELKLINEINHNSKRYKDVENNGIDEHETKDKEPSYKPKEIKNLKKRKHINYEHEGKVQREKNKVDDTEKDLKQTNSISKDREVLVRGLEIKDEEIHHLSHKMIHKKKDRRNKSKNTIKTARYKDIESNGIDEHETKGKKSSYKRKETKNFKKSKHRHEHDAQLQREKIKINDSEEDRQENVIKVIHKKKDRRSKYKKTSKTAESSTKPNKHKSKKKQVLRSSESLSTVKDNAVNKKHAKARLKTSKKVETTDLNSEEIKQSSNDETATKGIIKVTEDNINETTNAHSLRRIIEAFPSLFEKHTLQGLYSAYLWD